MDLDGDLRRLALVSPDGALDGVEAGVWRSAALQARAAEMRNRRRTAGVAALAVAALAGAAGVQAAGRHVQGRPSELAVLSDPGGLGGFVAPFR